MHDDEHVPLSPLAENLRRCYVARSSQARSNLPLAGNDLFGLYLKQLALLGGEDVALLDAVEARPASPLVLAPHASSKRYEV